MKLIVALLIACMVVAGFPSFAPAQVVTSDGGGSDDSGGSEANNTSLVILAVVVVVVFAAGYYGMSSKNSIAKAKESPLMLVACSDTQDNIAYDPSEVFSAGLAYRADF